MFRRILGLLKQKNGTCPICGGTRLLAFREVSSRNLLLCDECRHVFFEKMPTRRELDTYYSSQYTDSHQQLETQMSEDQRAYYQQHAEELAALAGKPLAEVTILDFGSSYPTFAKEAMDGGCREAISVDYSQEAREWGRRYGVQVITPEDMVHLEDASLHVLRYSHVLEHTVDPRALLENHLKKLKTNGLVYITQPSFPVFQYKSADVDLHDCVYPSHLHFFSALSVVTLAQVVGLDVINFFTVSDADEGKKRYAHLIDARYTERRLGWAEKFRCEVRDPLCHYPWFTGLNAALYARKTGPQESVD